jgi:two-component system OmpR family sensor kinase
MGVLVEDLLLLARLDSGRPLDLVEVDPVAIAAELAEDGRLLHPDRPLSLRREGDCRVLADPLRLRQAMVNLLANARQHTPERTPVDLSVERRGDQVVIEVADRGPGLGEAAADGRLFERFYRADPSRARASGGAGLGLSITAAILDAHDGSVEAADRDGGGAVFRLVLPAPVSAVSPEARRQEAAGRRTRPRCR